MKPQLLPDENLAYHVARLLILIGYCGKPQSRSDKLPAIVGRTLLAKLDFFMRYPKYLLQAAKKLQKPYTEDDIGIPDPLDVNTVESRMVRYLYGPWDSLYYNAIAYMVGKRLIEPPLASPIDVFRITPHGQQVLRSIASDPAFSDWLKRSNVIYHLFNAYTGTRLKQFIYTELPDAVSLPLGDPID